MLPPIANNFVAGEDVPAALDHVRELNERDVGALLNLLGEHYDERAPADADAAAYRDLVDEIDAAGLDAAISVKPSQLGLDVATQVFEANLARVVERARERDVFVWLDMEDHTTTDATLDVYEANVTDYPEMGVCVQANLRRTRGDLKRLIDLPGVVRLVKGAYDPPADVAYQGKPRIDTAYLENLALLFEHDDRVAVGSHDPEMIERAIELGEEFGTDFEIQMLMGVRESAQFELAAAGYDVTQYVPFGGKWLSYFYRRLKERRENVWFAAKAILKG